MTNTKNEFLMAQTHFVLRYILNRKMVYITKGILWILLVLLASCNGNTNHDSVKANNDTIQKYIELAAVDTLSSQKRNQFNDKAFSLIALEQNDTLTRYYLSETIYNNLKLRNWVALKKTAKVLLQKATAKNDTLNIARYYRYTAGYYKHNKEYDSAFYYYSKAEKLYKQLGRNYDLGIVLSNKGIVQFYVNDFSGAEFTLIHSEFLLNKSKDNFKLSEVLIATAAVYGETGEHNKALKSNLAALDLLNAKNSNEDYTRATCLNNIGSTYCKLNNIELANKFLKEALDVKDLEKKNPSLWGVILFNSANLRLKEKKYNEAKNLYLKALEIETEQEEYEILVGINIGLSDYYSKINDTASAIEYAKKAKNISTSKNIANGVLESLQQLIKVDTKNASATAQEYIKVNNSLQNKERQFRNKFARIALETDELHLEKNQLVNQKQIILGSAVVVFLIGLLFFILTNQRSKKKELRLIKFQQKADEEIYQLILTQKNIEDQARQTEKKRIALELHDGIMNNLTSTRLNLFVLSKRNDPETIASCLIHINQIRNIEQEIRNIAHDLNKNVFNETNSFVFWLEEFVNNQNAITKAHYTLELDSNIDWNGFSSEVKLNIYRIIQEASQNANKYSNASNVTISIIQDFDTICMSFTDNGVGFDPKIKNIGIGLQNIKDRVLLLNGKFTINSIKKGNTYINISIPMQLGKRS